MEEHRGTREMMMELFWTNQLGSFFVRRIEQKFGDRDINSIRRKIAREEKIIGVSFFSMLLGFITAVFAHYSNAIQFMPEIARITLALITVVSGLLCITLCGLRSRKTLESEMNILAKAVDALARKSGLSNKSIAQMQKSEILNLAAILASGLFKQVKLACNEPRNWCDLNRACYEVVQLDMVLYFLLGGINTGPDWSKALRTELETQTSGIPEQ